MCLILFSYMNHPDYDLILVSNRDEFYHRPTQPLAFWDDYPDILAGRDGQSQGSWLGLNRNGKFAAITNFRDPANLNATAPSRGLLVSDFLTGEQSAVDYLEATAAGMSGYNGFNLLVGDGTGLYYLSNRAENIEKVTPGIHGLSNAYLDTPWPKVDKGKQALARVIHGQKEIPQDEALDLMLDSQCPPDHELPETGVGIVWERLLAPLFISSETYGTRSSALVLVSKDRGVRVIERSYARRGDSYEYETRMEQWGPE